MYAVRFNYQRLLKHTTDLYYRAFPNDGPINKGLVYVVYLIELLQTLLMTHDAFTNFGYGFGDIPTLRDAHFDWLTIPIMSALGMIHQFKFLCTEI